MSNHQLFVKCVAISLGRPCGYALPYVDGKVVFGPHRWTLEQYAKLHRCTGHRGGVAFGPGEHVVVTADQL